MGINGFAISTNHPFNRYKPGQTVKGKVHFNLDEPKTVRGVFVRLKGIAKVSWHERTGGSTKNSSTNITYHAEHEYFNERIYFSGHDGGDSFELPAGDHDYKFEYSLPNRLPSPYECNYGSIKYTAKAVLDIPLGFDDEEEIILDVTSLVDLNLMPYLKKPEHRVAQKNLCCLCCQTGNMRMEIHLPKTGFTYGENIPIRLDVENSTNSKITTIDCELKQTVTLHSQYPKHNVKDVESILCRKSVGGVARRSTEEYDDFLQVPLTDDLNFDNCRLFEVSYNLTIKANVKGCHTNLYLTIPVTLGRIPIIQNSGFGQPASVFVGLGTSYPHDMRAQGDVEGASSNLLKEKL